MLKSSHRLVAHPYWRTRTRITRYPLPKQRCSTVTAGRCKMKHVRWNPENGHSNKLQSETTLRFREQELARNHIVSTPAKDITMLVPFLQIEWNKTLPSICSKRSKIFMKRKPSFQKGKKFLSISISFVIQNNVSRDFKTFILI